MSVLKLAYYNVMAQKHGVSLSQVRGLHHAYCVMEQGKRTYLFSDEELVQYIKAL